MGSASSSSDEDGSIGIEVSLLVTSKREREEVERMTEGKCSYLFGRQPMSDLLSSVHCSIPFDGRDSSQHG